jgi:RNA polymerase sigma factor (TIGR02999 family)
MAATVMRRILVDYARARSTDKRAGEQQKVRLDEVENFVFSPERCNELLALDEALDGLAEKDRFAARVVELRFFGGLSEEEVGEVLGVSETTVRRDWRFAKAWLHAEVSKRC